MTLSNIFKGRLFSTESTHTNWAKAGNYPLEFCGSEGSILRLRYSRLTEMFIYLSGVRHVVSEEPFLWAFKLLFLGKRRQEKSALP